MRGRSRAKPSAADPAQLSEPHASDALTKHPPMLIVGIGASAGGLNAFTTFFANMPADAGMAFVLVQHLDPHYRSMLVELLARHTAMTVVEAEDSVRVEENRVFVIPPNATLTIKDGTLRVIRPAQGRERRRPIDIFFSSLAEDQGENAVCIVLSGTGSDGTLGLRMIKDHGGLTLAQAGFDHSAMSGMPQSAAATGLVDHVMPVEDMPARLVEYRRHLNEVAGRKDGDGTRRDTTAHLARITALLRARVGHDFAQYKQNTLVRRIQRRMQVLQIDTVPAFVDHLRKEPVQLELLFREMLIGVTQFFRDPQAFEALQEKAVPDIVANKEASDQIRVWVPGCATGEEVYSIAILLSEQMERQGAAPKVQIFGTDIDDNAVTIARAGRYANSMVGMSPERIERWFLEEGGGYCPIKQIREMCVFSTHNLLRDPPFSKLDLISCRNLLIYLNADAQERVLRTFHYGLKSGGVLFLGPSEGIGRSAKLFAVGDKKFRLFRRRETDAPTHLPQFPPVGPATGTQPYPASIGAVAHGEDRIDKSVRRVLEKHSPAYVVVDKHHDILRFSGGGAGHYLAPSPGAANLNLFNLLRKGLRPTVRAAVQKAFAERQPVLQERLALEIDGQNRDITVIVEPIGVAGAQAELCVVAFQDLGPSTKPYSKLGADAADASLQELGEELRTTKAQLQATIDELETANEEMKSAAEEYQAVNEKLQSSNEELETAKEEMQSINEELQTVNIELSSKNDVLMTLNSDLRNLLESTEIATIFLSDDLRIKNFTPKMTDIFHLRDADRGRPITEIVTRLAYGNLQDDVRRVLRDLSVIEREVQIVDDGPTFLMRIRPYRTIDRVIEGVVITFVDITERRKAEELLREHAAIVEFAHDALIGVSLEGIVRSWNPGAERLFGYSAKEAIGQPFAILAAAGRTDEQIALIAEARAGNVAGPIETMCRRSRGSDANVGLTIVPIRAGDGKVAALAATVRDISERKHAEMLRALMLRELGHRVKNALANVHSIVRQTLRDAPTLEAFRQAFMARLVALSNTHDLLIHGGWQGAALRDLVECELAPYQSDERPRWVLEGADVYLNSQSALAIGMALHELATNAAKYGALSVPGGRVEITWQNWIADNGSRLHLSWVETGGPTVAKPQRKGFGTRLIEEALALELDGEVRLDFDPAGVRCSVDVPWERPEGAA